MFRRVVVIAPTLGLLVLDRASKIFFLKNSAATFGGDFLFGLLGLRLETNYGIAFGLTVPRGWLLMISALVILMMVFFILRTRSVAVVGAGLLIVVGAASNFFDRVYYGYVIDYIDVPYFTVLNLADVMITVGAILIAIILWRDNSQPD